MASQVLARKWRPQTFAQLIGQEPIVRALHNALVGDKLAQAYLFSGIRGVGKTTAARLLAKALNCGRGPAAEPCNECRSCSEIGTSGSLDVIEVDAATYSKVEQVRELTESLRYGPAHDRHKVVILDEVHRLSRQAFDALLKIVEEPPEHLVFIFATTELDSVPATILSRCQQYLFRRVPLAQLERHLRTICDEESIECSDVALRFIARAGDGSVRDAIAFLDQLATFGAGIITEEDTSSLLGGPSTSIFHTLLTSICSGNCKQISETVKEIEQKGWDPHSAYNKLLAHCRDAIHSSLKTDSERRNDDVDNAEVSPSFPRSFGYENLLRLTQCLIQSESTVRQCGFSILAFEIALLRAAELPKLTTIENAINKTSLSTDETSYLSSNHIIHQNTKTERNAAETDIPLKRNLRKPFAQSPQDDRVASFIERLGNRNRRLGALLQQALSLRFVDGLLEITGDSILCQSLIRNNNASTIEHVVQETWGPGANWTSREQASSKLKNARPVVNKSTSATQDTKSSKANTDTSSKNDPVAIAHPVVQATLDIFEGTVESVNPGTQAQKGETDQ